MDGPRDIIGLGGDQGEAAALLSICPLLYIPQPGGHHRYPVPAGEGVGMLAIRQNPPLIISLGRDQTAIMDKGRPEHWSRRHRLRPGIDRLAFSAQVISPTRHKAPAQQIKVPVFCLGMPRTAIGCWLPPK